MSSGDGILTITGFARFEKLLAEYQKVSAAYAKLQARQQQATQSSKTAQTAQQNAAAATASAVESIAMKWVSATAALNLYNAALRQQQDMANRAAGKVMDAATSQADFIASLGPNATTKERSAALRAVAQNAPSLGLQENEAYRIAALISNAVPDANVSRRVQRLNELTRLATMFHPNPSASVDDIGNLGASAGDLMKGVPGMTAQQAMRIEAGILAQSRLQDASKLPNITQALVAAQVSSPLVTDKLENTKQAAAIAAAISSRIGDPDGELSRTATSNLISVFRKKAGPKYADQPIMTAIRNAVEEDPGLIRKVRKDLKGRSFTKEAQAEFLFDGGVGDILATVARGELDTTDKQWNTFERDMKGLTPELKAARTVKRQAAIQDLANKRRADAGIYAAILFGGEAGGTTYPGALPSTAGLTDYPSDKFLEYSYWAAISNGLVTPKQAAMGVIAGAYEDSASTGIFNLFGSRGEAELAVLRKAMIDIAAMPEIMAENNKQISNGQNAQAAAAQRGAQTE